MAIMVNLIEHVDGDCVGAIDIAAILPIFRFFDFEKNGYHLFRYHNNSYNMTFYAVTHEGNTIFETTDKLKAIVKFISYVA
jgi:hypothetical protein